MYSIYQGKKLTRLFRLIGSDRKWDWWLKRNESLPGKFAASFPSSSSPSTPQDLKSDHGRYMIRRYYNISSISFFFFPSLKNKCINKKKIGGGGERKHKKNQSWKTMCHVKIMLLNKWCGAGGRGGISLLHGNLDNCWAPISWTQRNSSASERIYD